MQVIKCGKILTDDWQRIVALAPEDPLPDGDFIIPLAYWVDNQQALSQHQGNIAICLDGDDNVDDIANVLHVFDLIALAFPDFRDGRAYSHARLLRDKYNYRGELRAVGDVLRDQLFFMQRCGIDSFQVRADKNMEDALKGLADFTVKYQSAADGAPPLYKYR